MALHPTTLSLRNHGICVLLPLDETSFLFGTSQHNLDKLQRIHNLLARTVVNTTWSVNATEITRSLHWLPTRQRIHFKLALLAYKDRPSMLPSYLQNLLLDHHPARQLRSSSVHLFSKPAVTSTFASQAFSVSVPTVWNSLKPDLHSVDSLGSLKLSHFNLSSRAHCTLRFMAA